MSVLTLKVINRNGEIICEATGEGFVDLVCKRKYEEGDYTGKGLTETKAQNVSTYGDYAKENFEYTDEKGKTQVDEESKSNALKSVAADYASCSDELEAYNEALEEYGEGSDEAKKAEAESENLRLEIKRLLEETACAKMDAEVSLCGKEDTYEKFQC